MDPNSEVRLNAPIMIILVKLYLIYYALKMFLAIFCMFGYCVYGQTRKKYDDKISQKCSQQLSRRLKFTNLASEPQKNPNLPFYLYMCMLYLLVLIYVM